MTQTNATYKPDRLQIKLISPKMSLRPMDSEMKRKMSPPLSLVTIASMTPGQHDVFIEDENIKPINLNDKPDLVGITVNVDTVYRAAELASIYRAKGTKVIFGGIHASAHAEEMTQYCDAVCVGEAEEVWPTMLEDLRRGELKKIYHHPTPTDLSLVPIADWSFIKQKSNYLYYNIIVASRGCPFKCEFCYNSCDYVSGKYRNRPAEDIIEEIKRLDSKQIMFIDDNLIGNLNWMEHFLDLIEPMNVVWHGAVSTNIVHHPELISRMSATGCRSLFIGFESINPDSIKSVNKSQNKIGDYERLIKLLHDNNIMVNASLAFGFDHDTVETFHETLEWLVRNKVETMTGHILTPYPGTVLHKRFEEEGRIICRDLTKYNTSHVVFQPLNMTPEQLYDGYIGMYKQFYSLRNIIRRRPDNKKLLPAYFLFNFGYRKFGRITSLLGQMGLMNWIGRLARRLSYGI